MEITPRYAVSVNDSRSYVAAALSGMGVVQAPQFMVRDAVERGELVEVMTEWQRDPMPLYIVYPRTRHLGNRVRVFVDWLVRLLKETSASDAPPARAMSAGKKPKVTAAPTPVVVAAE